MISIEFPPRPTTRSRYRPSVLSKPIPGVAVATARQAPAGACRRLQAPRRGLLRLPGSVRYTIQRVYRPALRLEHDHPLADRAFRLYFVARLVSYLGSNVALVAIAFAVLRTGGSGAALGITIAAQTIPQLVLLLAGGVIADRLPRHRVLVAANLLMFASQGALAVGLLAGHAPLGMFVTTQLIYGAARAFSSPASAAIVKDLVSSEQLQRANALVAMSRDVLAIAGPVAGGAILALTSPAYAVAFDALTFAVAAALIARLRITRPTTPKPPSSGYLRDLREGWSEFRSRAWVWTMVCSFMLYQATVLPCLFVVGPVVALAGDLGAGGWSLVLGAQGVGALAGGVLLLRWSPPRPLLVANSLLVFESFFLIGLAADAAVLPLVGLSAIAAGGVVASDTIWATTLQREIPGDVLARVSSYDWLGSIALAPIGMAFFGYMTEVADPATLLLVVAAVNLLARVILTLAPAIRRMRHMPSPESASLTS